MRNPIFALCQHIVHRDDGAMGYARPQIRANAAEKT